uniref:Putative nwd2 protein n=1 Tax=Moniliophthora roreri TaxID=221103 RepID=A0A0W0EVF0_MONRR
MSDSDNPYEMRVVNPGDLGSSSWMFNNTHGTSINGGNFTSVGRDQIIVRMIRDSRTALDILSEFTKEEIKDDILKWCRDPSSDANVFWVHGPAGVGKSAIAQTIAELADGEGLLASSFFFSRSDGKRSDPTYLVPTIAYQLARIPELNVAMTKVIQQNPKILYSPFTVQFRELLIDSYRSAIELHPDRDWIGHLTRRVIVIDGIDECETQKTITQQVLPYGEIRPQDLIPPIASMLVENLPFRFLLFSRPEPRIREALEVASFGPDMRRLGLGNSWDARRDIRTFLDDGFSSVRTSPRNANIQFPDVWPDPGDVEKLVDKACGQFIYAATILKFVNDEYSSPMKQLSIVLQPSHTVKGNSPFKDLDGLYHQILSSNPNQSEVVQVLCTLLCLQLLKCHRLSPNPKSIERLLGLTEGEVSATLRGMHSVLNVSGPEADIHILHVSFHDFLRDKSRSGPCYIQVIPHLILLSWNCGLQRMLAEPVMFGCLWSGFVLLAPTIATPLLSIIMVLVPVPSNSTLLSAFVILCVLSAVPAGLVALTWIVIGVKSKTPCLHVRSWFVKVEVGLVCIANVISIISYLILILAYTYNPDTDGWNIFKH